MSIRRFFNRRRWDDERARELDAHLAHEIDEQVARGLTPDDARAAARRKLGNVTRIREDIYDMNSLSVLETARLDLRDALRQLRRRPLVTSLAFLLLTIGISAAGAAFSVAYGVLVRPLPYPDADRLAALWQDERGELGQVSYPDYRDLQSAVPFDAAVVFGSGRATLTGGVDADRVNVVNTEPPLLGLLGARPIIGRLIEPQDNGRRVVVISHRLWQHVFHGDTAIVGTPIGLSGTPYAIVGVAAAGLDFELPVGGASVGSAFTIKDVDAWTPFDSRESSAQNRAVSTYQVIVRLRAGQALDTTQRGVDLAASNLAQAYPATNRNRTFRLVALRDHIVDHKSAAVRLGFAGALLILIIACANVTSLLLGDWPDRRRDFALREALGASRGRLVRQLAVESVLLSGAAAVAGLAVARVAVASLKRAADLPRLDAIRFDAPVVSGVIMSAIAVGLVARLLPLLRVWHARDELRPSVSAYATSAPILRRTLVVVQLALAVVLSATGVLLAVSFRHIAMVDPGFARVSVLSARVSAFAARYPTQADATRFVRDLVVNLSRVPGIQAAAAASTVPLAGASMGTAVGVEGRLAPMAERATAGWQTVTTGYFAALGIPVRGGRDFTPADLERGSHVTVINQSLARRLFGDGDPVGHRLAYGASDPSADWHEIVGVVGDVHHGSLAEAASPRAYDLFGQHWSRTMYLVVRGSAEPHALTPVMRATVRQLDPEAPVFDVQSLDDIVDATIAPRRLATAFAGGTAATSVLLAAIGLYGLLASSVSSRTRELGIRRALGSSTSAIVRVVLAEAALLGAVGILLGAVAALASARAIQSQLFGVQASDPGVIAAIAIALSCVGLAAAGVPARRAATIDPVIALRDE